MKKNFMGCHRKGGENVAAYKDEKRGTWYVSFHYNDWTGKNCRKVKRGFKTKRDATEWERHFRMKEEKFGTEMNVIKDGIFEGTLLNMINEAIAYLDTQVKEKTYLGPDGTFVTDEEYPKFVRQELIVNAVTHRAYSITGTDIQIKMFDDHIVVESPGKLPGLVRADNIRFTHFSRNPKIAEFLKNYKFVKEFGEGVNRMCNELEQVGLKDPVYHTNAFMLQAVIYNSKVGKTIVEKKLIH